MRSVFLELIRATVSVVVRLPGASSSSAPQSRPWRGMSCTCFGSMLLPRTDEETFRSGASAVTVIVSASVDGDSCRFTTSVSPTSSCNPSRTTVVKPGNSAAILYAPTRAGMRYTPRSSVTAAKVLPVASSTAVTTTPGSTPPVESVTVPVNVASSAEGTAGSSRLAVDRSSRLTIANVITPPETLTWGTHDGEGIFRDRVGARLGVRSGALYNVRLVGAVKEKVHGDMLCHVDERNAPSRAT